ncbi:MAG: TPM domain-containing protein [Bacteroidota bacterium]
MAKFLTKPQEKAIVAAIAEAEKQTSGEVRVHLEPSCKTEDPIERAKQVFAELNMHNTELRNGILVYVATKDHKLAIWGGEGIHEKVGQAFWDNEVALLVKYFKAGDHETGLTEVIRQIGERLKEHFPYQNDDVNELPDDISYGGEDDA